MTAGDEAASGNPGRLARRVADAMQARDPVLRLLGMEVVEVGPGFARLRMTVREEMTNGHALAHGGMIFTLADTAFAYACNAANAVTVASQCAITFVAPARPGDVLEAIAEERVMGRRTGVYDVTVRDARTSAPVALFRGNAHRVGGPIVE